MLYDYHEILYFLGIDYWRRLIMPFSKLGINRIKFSVVEQIIDSKGKEFLVEVKFSKSFFSNYSNDVKDELIVNLLDSPIITSREIEVLKYIAQGKNNSEIAENLNVSIHTAKVHIQNIFKKLSVSDRTAAVVVALKLGLLHL